MKDLLTRPVMWAVTAGLLVLAIVVAIHFFASGQRAKVEAKLGRNQVDAATKSGADAVNAVAGQHAAEAAADELTRSNADEIRHAPGADAPVDPRASAAGLRVLCRRPAYSQRPECLQHSPAR